MPIMATVSSSAEAGIDKRPRFRSLLAKRSQPTFR
jgi:hypothetical protein